MTAFRQTRCLGQRTSMIAEITPKDQLKTNSPLDLFSISQTSEERTGLTWHEKYLLRCVNNAPFFAYKTSNKGYDIVQGNCNSWTCPRCGNLRARKEYGRILEGCRTLAKDWKLYFITLTCRGKGTSWEQAEAGYLLWTNRLLTTLRKSSKKHDVHWAYCQVTERQSRGHPHSHLLTTYYPHDLREGTKTTWKHVAGKLTAIELECLRSDYLEQRCISAGLGEQYDISEVRTVEAASRYVAKYMFKDTMFSTDWPKKWRRVRYSRSFPKLPEQKSDAFVLLKNSDWRDLARKAVVINPQDVASYEAAGRTFYHDDVIVRKVRNEAVSNNGS